MLQVNSSPIFLQTPSVQKNFFAPMATDVVKTIASFLAPGDIRNLATTSSFYHKLFNQEFWQKHTAERFPDLKTAYVMSGFLLGPVNWRETALRFSLFKTDLDSVKIVNTHVQAFTNLKESNTLVYTLDSTERFYSQLMPSNNTKALFAYEGEVEDCVYMHNFLAYSLKDQSGLFVYNLKTQETFTCLENLDDSIKPVSPEEITVHLSDEGGLVKMRSWPETTPVCTVWQIDKEQPPVAKAVLEPVFQIQEKGPCCVTREGIAWVEDGYIHQFRIKDKTSEIIRPVEDEGTINFINNEIVCVSTRDGKITLDFGRKMRVIHHVPTTEELEVDGIYQLAARFFAIVLSNEKNESQITVHHPDFQQPIGTWYLPCVVKKIAHFSKGLMWCLLATDGTFFIVDSLSKSLLHYRPLPFC